MTVTDNRTLKDLSSKDLDNMSLEEWAAICASQQRRAIAKRTEPTAVVDLLVSCSKGEIPVCDAVVAGQAIYRNRREHGIEG
jgi:hypothetical protein